MRIPKALKICCGVTAFLIITLLVVILILSLTVFKPKQPKVSTKSVTLENIRGGLIPIIFPFQLNVTLGIVVTIDNPNYGSFKYENSTAYITYRGNPAAEGPIQEDTIPARGKHDISTTVVLVVDHLTSNPKFKDDFATGCLNFTSSTKLHGKATVFKLLTLKATSYSTCDISVFIKEENATSHCTSKIKF